jgi:hypothetical protein
MAAETSLPLHGLLHPPARGDVVVDDVTAAPYKYAARSGVARGERRFAACYERALGVDAEASGVLVVTVLVGAAGFVGATIVSVNRGLSAELARCVEAGVRASRFEPPNGGTATVSITLRFVPQKG